MKIQVLLFISILTFLLTSCSRTKDPDEIVLSEMIFEEDGFYYFVNCSDHSNYQKFTGIDTCYYDNGNIKSIFKIKNGRPNGHWIKLNQNGTIKIDLYFKNGELIKKSKSQVADKNFLQFLKKFKSINLPFIYRETKEVSTVDINKLVKLNLNSKDTLYIKKNMYSTDEIYCYGLIKDNSNFYTLIYYFSADSFYPVVITYNKSGKIISQKCLIVNGCGGDCGLVKCSSNGILNKNYSIYCADSLTYEYHCDSLGESIPNSDEIYANIEEGKINKNGTFKLIRERSYSNKK